MIGGDDVDFTHEELKVLQSAIDHYGEESQLDMAIEEMSELTKAICKYKRHKEVMTLEPVSGEIYTFVQYAGDGFIFAYDDMGHFKILYMHDVTVIT